MADTFADFVARERERLNQEREAVSNQQRELQQKLAGIERELSAMNAYEAAKSGKAVPGRAAAGRRTARGRRGSKRGQLLDIIKAHPNGVTRGEILEQMGLKGDKSGEMSVSNALTALAKTSQVTRRDGRYVTG
jgi:hypothetical protein